MDTQAVARFLRMQLGARYYMIELDLENQDVTLYFSSKKREGAHLIVNEEDGGFTVSSYTGHEDEPLASSFTVGTPMSRISGLVEIMTNQLIREIDRRNNHVKSEDVE